jgi:serine/threonine-protein kinase
MDSVPSLIAELRAHRLLSPAQLDELDDLHPRAQPRLLADELLRRNWLTGFQVQQLFDAAAPILAIDHYVLLDRLGEGATGQVYKARHRQMQRVAAIKVIRPELLANAEVVGRFYREIEAAGRLSHPNVIVAYDAGPYGSTHFFAMEYVEGIDLHRLVKQSGPLPIAKACDFIRQAALGLQHAHERGLVHRDIKPSNLLVASGKGLVASEEETAPAFSLATSHQSLATVKILDLGLARVHQATNESRWDRGLTLDGAVMGTPDFMAPEQADDARSVDIRADIYSLGCSLYFLLSGQVPFPNCSLYQKMLKLQQAEPMAIETLRPGLPREVAEVIRRLMAKRPEDRYQTPAEVADALSACAGSVPSLGVATLAIGGDAGQREGEAPAEPQTCGDSRLGRSLALPAPRRKLRWPIFAAAGGAMLTSLLLWLFGPAASRRDVEREPVAKGTAPKAAASTAPVALPGPPYPPSTVIKGIDWDFANVTRLAEGSDGGWLFTWADDDNLYVSWHNGGGFRGNPKTPRQPMGISRITGFPPIKETGASPSASNVWGGVSPLVKEYLWADRTPVVGSAAGLVCVNGILVMTLRMGESDPKRNIYPDCQLAYSADHGQHWYKLSSTLVKGQAGKVLWGEFLQFQADYAGAPEGLVYLYGDKCGDAANTFLLSMPRDKLTAAAVGQLDLTSVRYFAGLDARGQPVWSADLRRAQAVFTEPELGSISVIYNPGLKRYIATGQRGMNKVGESDFGSLAVYDAPNPWGPWTTVARYTQWSPFKPAPNYFLNGYGVRLPTKWLSANGKGFYVVFSSNSSLKCFNLAKGSFVLPGPRDK